MRAMVLDAPGEALQLRDVQTPSPGRDQVLVRVSTCAVCRTDLHILDGELLSAKLPLILGHQIVGRIESMGQGVTEFRPSERVGIPWLGWTDGECKFCRSGRENLCDRARFTGYNIDGGYAEFTVADARFCFRLPDAFDDVAAAPLLCAGLIGFRALRKCGDAKRIGFYGFGSAAHILAQVAAAEGREIFAFTRPGDTKGQQLARELGAVWSGGSDEIPPKRLEAAIIFAPVGALVPAALRTLEKAGAVVCAGIHMSDIPSFAYADLWEERAICSVANLTRGDGEKFLSLAAKTPLRIDTEVFPLAAGNEALARHRAGQLSGTAVLMTAWA